MRLTYEVFQSQGPKGRQEDSFFIAPGVPCTPSVVGAVGVMDGVSSSRDGHAAALRAALYAQVSLIRNAPLLEPRNLAKQALLEANLAVLGLRRRRAYKDVPEHELPAAVVVIALVNARRELIIGYAGDSVALLQRDGQLFQLTKPHANDLGEVERYFGQESFEPQILTGKLLEQDTLFLMTDGAYDVAIKAPPGKDPLRFLTDAGDDVFTDNATAIRVSMTSSKKLTTSHREPVRQFGLSWRRNALLDARPSEPRRIDVKV